MYSAPRAPAAVKGRNKNRGPTKDDPEQYEATIAICREKIKHDPNDVEAHRMMAYSHALLGDGDESLRCFKRAVERDELNPELRNDMGDTMYNLERYGDAAAAFGEAWRLDPSNYVYRLKEAHMMRMTDRCDEAAAAYDGLIPTLKGKAAAEALTHKGDMLDDLGKHERAVEVFREALEADPDFAPARTGLAMVLDTIGRGNEAVSEYKKSLKASPKSAQALFNMGVALAKQGRYAEALAQFDKGMAIDDTDGSTHRMRGDLLDNLGRPREAVKSYKRAVEIDPSDSLSYYNMGTSLAQMDRPKAAAAAYRRAIRLRPSHGKSYGNLGAVLHDLGRYKEALAAQREAIRINPEDAGAHYNAGLALFSLGKLGAAEKSHRRSLEIRPDFAPARDSLEQVLAARKAVKELGAENVVLRGDGMIILGGGKPKKGRRTGAGKGKRSAGAPGTGSPAGAGKGGKEGRRPAKRPKKRGD